MYLQIKKIKLVPDKFGQHIEITMVGLYQDDGTYVKWVKLDDSVLSALINIKMPHDGSK